MFSQAKIIGTSNAQDKMKVINALPRGWFDYNAAKADDMDSLNEELGEAGVSLFYVEGDVCTTAVVVVAHGVLLRQTGVHCRSNIRGSLCDLNL